MAVRVVPVLRDDWSAEFLRVRVGGDAESDLPGKRGQIEQKK